jgi:hypothetical protein
MSATVYKALADLVLVLHLGFVAFVILGLLLILAGGFRHWGWIRNPWFRLLHLAAIGVVVIQAWFGVICPLTTLEMSLRQRAGETAYNGSFIEHWVQKILFYEGPGWIFTVAYTLFGLLVVGTWAGFPPRLSIFSKRRSSANDAGKA